MTAAVDAVPGAPVAIGGVGGSGTRLIAEMMRALGIAMGADLNHASDNLWFSLLFSRHAALGCSEAEFDLLTSALVAGLSGCAPDPAAASMAEALANDGRPQHPRVWLQERARTLRAAFQSPPVPSRWGWKEPNTHVFIERLWQRLPRLKYIHVVRNGANMAYSRNQRQLRFWGPDVLGSDGPLTPTRSLAYWCRVHQRMEQLLAANPDRMLWLDYDHLCANPEAGIDALLAFLEHPIDGSVEQLAALVRPGSTRAPAGDGGLFEPADLDYLGSLGYQLNDPPDAIATRPGHAVAAPPAGSR